MKRLFFGGKMPYSVTISLVIAAYAFGARMERTGLVPGAAPVSCQLAVADEDAVLLEAALNHPELDRAGRQASIVKPVRDVLDQYRKRGYTVIDTSRNDDGAMTVAAVPPGTLDITNDLRRAVGLTPLVAPKAPPAAAASAPLNASSPSNG